MGKLIKFFWLVTLLTAFGVLLYTYAALGQEVWLEPGITSTARVSRNVYFYGALGLLVLFNFSFYAVSNNMRYKLHRLNEMLTSWQLGFAGMLNFFFIVSALFVMVLNAGDKFDYNNFGYLIYLALGLIGLWILALPVVIYKAR